MTIKNVKSKRIVRDRILANQLALRVIGSEKVRFRLAGERHDGVLFPFGQLFKRQMDAIQYGETKFNQTAKKVAQPRRRQPVAVG